jgi:hypothetical protein
MRHKEEEKKDSSDNGESKEGESFIYLERPKSPPKLEKRIVE